MRTDLPCPPIGLSRPLAAAHVGMGISLFDKLVADGRMPRPRKAEGRLIWHRLEIEKAFAELPVYGGPNPEGAENSFSAITERLRADKAEEVESNPFAVLRRKAHDKAEQEKGKVGRK